VNILAKRWEDMVVKKDREEMMAKERNKEQNSA